MQATAAIQFKTSLAPQLTRVSKAPLREVTSVAAPCVACNMRERCVTSGLRPEDSRALELPIGRRMRLRKGGSIFRAGDRFTSLFAIRAGSCKTVLTGQDGIDQVAGYHMAGDIIGTDGIGDERHDCEAIALEDVEICRLPFEQLEKLAQQNQKLLHTLHRLLAAEITRERRTTLILGSMRADQRLATFLLDLGERYRERGYSPVEFVLRMTRDEIGSYLGLKLETVSRLLSRFHADRLIDVNGRVVKLLDPMSLRVLVGSDPMGTNTGIKS